MQNRNIVRTPAARSVVLAAAVLTLQSGLDAGDLDTPEAGRTREVDAVVLDGHRLEVGTSGAFFSRCGERVVGRLDRLYKRGRRVIALVMGDDGYRHSVMLA